MFVTSNVQGLIPAFYFMFTGLLLPLSVMLFSYPCFCNAAQYLYENLYKVENVFLE